MTTPPMTTDTNTAPEFERLVGALASTYFRLGWLSPASADKTRAERNATMAAIVAYEAAQRAEIAALRAEVERLDKEVEHFARLACDDLGKNPPDWWKDRAEKAEAEIARLSRELAEARVPEIGQ